MATVNAMKHLYPGIKHDQFNLRDDSDGQGPYLEYLDPALGDIPSDVELIAADLAYLQPSYLDAGEREPTSVEMRANLTATYNYFVWRVQSKLDAAVEPSGVVTVIRNPNGTFTKKGSMGKMGKHGLVTGTRRARMARRVITWEASVWDYLEDQWALITAVTIEPPTWSELNADLDRLFPTPNLNL